MLASRTNLDDADRLVVDEAANAVWWGSAVHSDVIVFSQRRTLWDTFIPSSSGCSMRPR